MKKLLLLFFSFLLSFNSYGGSQLDFTLSDFCYKQPNVQDRGGVFYYPNQEVGITDSSLCVYKDLYGQYMSKVELVNGKFEGKFIRWWENGQKHQEKHYKNGKLDGKSSGWWSDGRKYYIKNYKNDVLNGLSTQWYETVSQKQGEGEYIDGKANGKWTFWFPNGQIAQEYFKIDGKRDGKWLEYGINGKLIRESSWKDGECISGDWCPGSESFSYSFALDGDEDRETLDELFEIQSQINKDAEEKRKLEEEKAKEAEEKAKEAEILAQEVAKQVKKAEEKRKAEEAKAKEAEQKRKSEEEKLKLEEEKAKDAEEKRKLEEEKLLLVIEDQLNTLKSAYVSNIAARIKSVWRYQGAEDDWECDVYVVQDRDGTVVAVDVRNCNVDDSNKAKVFKDSIRRAVYKASPLPSAPDESVFDKELVIKFSVN